jgi:uncharacterized phage protein gp47/JayE
VANFLGTKGTIVRRGLDTLAHTTNIRQAASGGKARALLEIVGQEVENISILREDDLRKPFLRTSSGIYTDHFGNLTGVSRYLRRNAEVFLEDQAIRFSTRYGDTFGSINGGNDFTIPDGTRLQVPEEIVIEHLSDFYGSGDGTGPRAQGISYVLTGPVVCESDATYVYASARALTPGSNGNIAAPGMLVRHDFTGYLRSPSNLLVVSNTKPILNGLDEESQESYKYRISTAITDMERGNYSAILTAARSVPGVADASIIPHEGGAGQFTVYIKSISSFVSDKTIRDVRRQIEAVMSLGDVVQVKKPFEIGLEIASVLIYRDSYSDAVKAIIRRNLEIVAMSYINNGGLGQPVSLEDLANTLRSADNRILDVGSNEVTRFDSVFVYYPAKLAENLRRRERIITEVVFARPHSRILVENSIETPISFM